MLWFLNYGANLYSVFLTIKDFDHVSVSYLLNVRWIMIVKCCLKEKPLMNSILFIKKIDSSSTVGYFRFNLCLI